MTRKLWTWLCAIVRQLWQWLMGRPPWARRRGSLALVTTRASPRRHPILPKPTWVQQEVIRLKALWPQAGCRTIAHHFNRRWQSRRQMTVSKTYVADTCRRHQYRIDVTRRKLKHRVPRPMRRNLVWECDLLMKTDAKGQPNLALAIVDHGSRACLRLQRLSDKSSWTLLQELIHAVKQYGRPTFLTTDNDAVLVSRVFRFGLWLLGIRQQRIEPGCPWQNGRVESAIGAPNGEISPSPHKSLWRTVHRNS